MHIRRAARRAACGRRLIYLLLLLATACLGAETHAREAAARGPAAVAIAARR